MEDTGPQRMMKKLDCGYSDFDNFMPPTRKRLLTQPRIRPRLNLPMSNEDDRNGIIPFESWPLDIRAHYRTLHQRKSHACNMAMEWANRRDTLIKQMDKMNELIGQRHGPLEKCPETGRKRLSAKSMITHADVELMAELQKAIRLAYKKNSERMPWE